MKSREHRARSGVFPSLGLSKGKVKDSFDGFITFKKTAQAGVEAGQIESIIHPLPAGHVLREALTFSDELKGVSYSLPASHAPSLFVRD
jgi:hypothetical protein